MTEQQVTQKWQELLALGCKLETQSGQGLEILYPGKTSDAPGSDFQDAVIRIGNEVTRGNIEIHVKSSGWRAHRHHQNPAYNGVVLHVAMWQDQADEAELQNGLLIPTVIIVNQRREATGISGVTPCSGIATRAGEHLMRVLDRAGEERFYEKATRFRSEMEEMGAGQCLYCGIMESLGYSCNKKPFLMLAKKVSLFSLESMMCNSNEEEGLLVTQALLMGTAGFLSSGIPDDSECEPYLIEMGTRWKALLHDNVMFQSDWQVFRVRPGNSPLRRMAGVSALIRRCQPKGLLNTMVELVSAVPAENNIRQLEDGLMVGGDNTYWTSHYTLGGSARG